MSTVDCSAHAEAARHQARRHFHLARAAVHELRAWLAAPERALWMPREAHLWYAAIDVARSRAEARRHRASARWWAMQARETDLTEATL